MISDWVFRPWVAVWPLLATSGPPFSADERERNRASGTVESPQAGNNWRPGGHDLSI